MIHLIKTNSGHNRFVDFGSLTDDQISELLGIAGGKTRATMPSVTLPEGSDEEVRKYTKLVAPKRFFPHGNGHGRDLSNPKVMPFKILGTEILDAIASDTQTEITHRLAELETEKTEAESKGETVHQTTERDGLERKQKYLDAFRKAAKVLG